MVYEYKGKFLTLAEMYLNTGNFEPNLEIEEVYRKAQALDRIEGYLADQQGYDWDDEYTLTLIAGEVEKVVMEEG